jgi:Periplasmic binding protein-like domain
LTGELLALPEPPTAIFAASDTQALGVIEAVNRSGLAVPGDVSVVGFDDLEIAAYVGLTTVRRPDCGSRGCRIAAPRAPQQTLVRVFAPARRGKVMQRRAGCPDGAGRS